MDFPAGGPVWFVLAGAAVALLVGAAIVLLARRRSGGRVIRVVGVGGGGANAVEAMIRARLKGVEYVVVNTDLDALRRSSARTKIAIGRSITNGLGAGGDVSAGESAARDAADEIGRALAGCDLVVITAGLGGGTGSGAAPVISEIARQQDVLTVAVVTKPFGFEGARRRQAAQDAAAAMVGLVDAVATVPNDRVRELMPADVTVEDAFRAIDETLHRSVAEIVDLIAVPGRINLDFADVRGVLRGGGAAAVGFGRASGENRATEATRNAMAATLLETRMEGATSVLVNVSGSRKLRLAELDAVAETVLAAAGRDANLVFGMSLQPSLRDEVQVTVIATGFGPGARPLRAPTGMPAPVEEPARKEKPAPMGAPVEATAPAVATAPAEATVQAEAAPSDWRPVWLRRSDTPESTPPAKPVPAPRSRRPKRAAERARRDSRGATDVRPPAPEDENGSPASE